MAEPTAQVTVGGVQGTSVALLPRHGKQHEFAPHRINHRANMGALRSLGGRQVLAPSAVGGLRAEVAPRDLVVPDQLVGHHSDRAQSYVQCGAVQVPFAEPSCPTFSEVVASHEGVLRGGAVVVADGPRFSTRADSRHYAAQGRSLVNMTGCPEAVLAQEILMRSVAIALVTDMDAGIESGEGVGQKEVFAMHARNIDRLERLLTASVPRLPRPGAGCTCTTRAGAAELPYRLP